MHRIAWLGIMGLLILPTMGRAADGVTCRVSPKFSSEGSIAAALTRAIRKTDQRIDLALYGFNNDDLAQELVSLAERGVMVRVKVDSTKARGKKPERVLKSLKKSGIQILPVAAEGRNHNKFAVIDGKRVLTGSYNWTRKAEGNWENLLILDCPELASAYQKEWEKIR